VKRQHTTTASANASINHGSSLLLLQESLGGIQDQHHHLNP
jgi:hypothetical protein